MRNLFSYLSKEQFESLTDEERRSLARIDEKLFPDDPHANAATDLFKEWQERHEAHLRDNEEYAKQMQESFAR